MRDYEQQVLKQYNLEIISTRKMRGAFFCNTNIGPILLKEVTGKRERIAFVQEFCRHLKERGYVLLDEYIPNQNGELLSRLEENRYDDGRRYVVKRWFHGRECNVNRLTEMCAAAENLGKLHLAGRCNTTDFLYEQLTRGGRMLLAKEMERHNRQLLKIRAFMRNRQPRGQFETMFLTSFPRMIAVADQALWLAKKLALEEKEGENSMVQVIHGEYNYHNVLLTAQGIATVNLERARVGERVEDLYYFLRKCMEKHRWNISAGEELLKAYDQVSVLKEKERMYLALRSAYPEKYWKIANVYYYSKKVKVQGRFLEKLENALQLEESKNIFLRENRFFSFGTEWGII